MGPTVVYTHAELPWRYFNHTTVVDGTLAASAEIASAAARRMHSLGRPASFELETFENPDAWREDPHWLGNWDRAEESARQSKAWASVLDSIGCTVCDRLLVMAMPIHSTAAIQTDALEPSFATGDLHCRITAMPLKAIDRQVQLHRAGFGGVIGRPASVDRRLVTANLRAGVQYFWTRPPAHPEPVGSAAVMIVEDVAEIFALSVVPAYRGQGIGRRLMETSLQYARSRGCNLAYLQSELNSRAATLYGRLGFVPLWQQVSYIL